jgi:hypothetical protein
MPDGTQKLSRSNMRPSSLGATGSGRYDSPRRGCEGEKATDGLLQNRIPALGTFGADVMPGDDTLRVFLRRPVFIWPDNDD